MWLGGSWRYIAGEPNRGRDIRRGLERAVAGRELAVYSQPDRGNYRSRGLERAVAGRQRASGGGGLHAKL